MLPQLLAISGESKVETAMKRIQNHLVGIDQGSEMLFEDYDTDGEMWTARGNREVWHSVRFATPFKSVPAVHVSVSMWDMSVEANQRADLRATNIRREGFELVFTTWEDSKVARIRADWMAIGELPHEDDWSLY